MKTYQNVSFPWLKCLLLQKTKRWYGYLPFGILPWNQKHSWVSHIVSRKSCIWGDKFEVVALRYINEFGPISFKTPAISFQAFQKLKYIAWSMSAAQAGVMAWLWPTVPPAKLYFWSLTLTGKDQWQILLFFCDRVPLASKFSDILLLALGFKLLLLMVHLLLLVTWYLRSQQVGPRKGLLACTTDRKE